MPQASARHILVETEDQCNQLVTDLNNGGDFAALASEPVSYTHLTLPTNREV